MAYRLYEDEGNPEARAEEHWARAEQFIHAERLANPLLRKKNQILSNRWPLIDPRHFFLVWHANLYPTFTLYFSSAVGRSNSLHKVKISASGTLLPADHWSSHPATIQAVLFFILKKLRY